MIIFTQGEEYAINSDHVVAYGLTKTNGVSIILCTGASCTVGEYSSRRIAKAVMHGIVFAIEQGHKVYGVPDNDTEVQDGSV